MPSSSRRTALGAFASVPLLAAKQTASSRTFVDVLRSPDLVRARTGSDYVSLERSGRHYQSSGVAVEVETRADRAAVFIDSPGGTVCSIQLRWLGKLPRWRILGDAWERSYGDLGWNDFAPERFWPWYVALSSGAVTHCYGVETGCHAFCFWQVDDEGISLWLDLRNGGEPAQLGGRRLLAVSVCARRGGEGESPFTAVEEFCRGLCSKPLLPRQPVYGNNTWYYTYGKDFTSADVIRGAKELADLAPSATDRPFLVIDDGWQSNRHTAGPWKSGNEAFPDMPHTVSEMRKAGVRPGIWLRPLATSAAIDPAWCLTRAEAAGREQLRFLDPTVPEALSLVRADMARVRSWGAELIKHDFSSFDLFGRWGFAMGPELTNTGWHFHDQTKTNAEVVLELYRAIRESAGTALILGCNTFSHLCAGLVELNRTGDDVSGRAFDRTRRMGINTLAFRAPQHDAFYVLDADCAPITEQVPWDLSRRWLHLLAKSGTATFLSADIGKLTAEQRKEARTALEFAAKRQERYQPLDWFETRVPSRWALAGREQTFQWFDRDGTDPFNK